MSRLWQRMGIAGLALAASAIAGAQAVNRLDFVARPRLIECNNAPCFKLDLNAVNASDQPMSVDTQIDRWKVTRDGVPQKVFYVTAKEGGAGGAQGARYLLLLIDVSGSMAQPVAGTADSRFTAAKKALTSWAASLKEGVDHVAVVPFESHRVVPTIGMATFASSPAEVRQQIADLPAPRPINDTALFTAIVSGLELLEPQRKAGNEPVLLVFTDGDNDVKRPGNDPGLLGNEGLKIARDAAYRAGVSLFTIGFGAAGETSFNESALRSLAYPNESFYNRVSTGPELQQVLERARQKVSSGVQLFVGPIAESKARLTNQTVNLKVSYAAPGGETLETVKDTPWITGGMTEPNWEGHLEPGPVYQAFLDSSAAPETSPLTPFKRPLVLLMYGAILALLWFGIPRIVWPERYLARPVAPPPPQQARPPAPQWAPPPRPGAPPMPPPTPRVPQRPAAPPAPTGGETVYADPRGGGRPPAPATEQTVYIRPEAGKFRPPDKPGPKR